MEHLYQIGSKCYNNLCMNSLTYQIIVLGYNLANGKILEQSIIEIISITSLLIISTYTRNMKKGSQIYIFKKICLRCFLLISLLFLTTFPQDIRLYYLSLKIKYFLIGRFTMKYCNYKEKSYGIPLLLLIFSTTLLHFEDVQIITEQPIFTLILYFLLTIQMGLFYCCQYQYYINKQNQEFNVAQLINEQSDSRVQIHNQNKSPYLSKTDKLQNELLLQESSQKKEPSIKDRIKTTNNNNKENEFSWKSQIGKQCDVSPDINNSLFKFIMKQYPEGIIIFQSKEQVSFVSQRAKQYFHQQRQKILNCQRELDQQNKVNKAYQCLKTKLTKKSSRPLIEYDHSIISEEDEPLEQGDDLFLLHHDVQHSDLMTIEEEFDNVLEQLNGYMQNLYEDELNKIHEFQFIHEVKMICSQDGSFNSENLQSQYQSMSSNLRPSTQSVFQINLKSFLYEGRGYVLLIIKDVTFFNQIQALQKINENKSKMLSQVAHEFRTPLNCIILLIQNLMETADEETNQDYLRPVLTSANQLLSLINDLLDLAQLRAGKFKLVNHQFDLRELLNDIYILLNTNVSAKGNTLKIEIPKDLSSKVVSDVNRIRQIILNLVSNANKYTSNGTIVISVEQIEQLFFIFQVLSQYVLELAVQDTGLGIEKEDQEKLFKAFGKLDKGKEMNTQGVGLGLMISNILAERLAEPEGILLQDCKDKINPGLRVYSEGHKKGTKFSFQIIDQKEMNSSSRYIPLNSKVSQRSDFRNDHQRSEQDENPSIIKRVSHGQLSLSYSSNNQPQPLNNVMFEKPSIAHQNQSFEQLPSQSVLHQNSLKSNKNMSLCKCLEILIVDDESINILALKQSIKKYNLKIDVADNGQTALEKVKNFKKAQDCHKNCQNYKAILMDMEMPVLSGTEATKKIRQLEVGKDIYIVGCSGNGNEAIQTCLQAGMNDYLIKPLKISKLIEILKMIQIQFS